MKESSGYFKAYYSFTALFCNPDSGNEKGGVEGLVGFARRNYMVPVPKADNLEELNEKILRQCIAYGNHQITGRDRQVNQLYDDFLGRSGTGKTHMATALGIEACRNNFRTRFVTCYGLVTELIEARQEKALQRLLQRYARYELVILDELGYIPFSKEGSELLFQVLAERHEKGSVMITTNLGFADWTQVFGDPVMTAALLDRLTHKARIINCNWESYRLKQSLREKSKHGERKP